MTSASPRLARFTLATIGVNLLVILWGAWVRASGSGAGCGRHWPLCDGQIIPSAPDASMLTEFAHRATSGIALLLVIGMVVLARRDFPLRHAARRWAWLSLLFIALEALIGAGLVLFQYVAHDDSIGRALWLGAHLLNTLLMLAAFGLTWWTARGGEWPGLGAIGRRHPWLLAGLAVLLLTGMSGAIASLGDTLFPSGSLREGLQQDFSPTAHLLLRLRVWHPVLAISTGLLWLVIARGQVAREEAGGPLTRAGHLVMGLVLTQWTIGVSALILLVPVALQLLHLLTADLLWLAAVRLTITAATAQPGRTSPATSRAASASNTRPAPLSR